MCAIRTNQGAASDRIDESNTLHNVCRVSGERRGERRLFPLFAHDSTSTRVAIVYYGTTCVVV